jgi:hypothetical protein
VTCCRLIGVFVPDCVFVVGNPSFDPVRSIVLEEQPHPLVLMFFDVTRRPSFNSVRNKVSEQKDWFPRSERIFDSVCLFCCILQWFREIESYVAKDPNRFVFLIGTHVDLRKDSADCISRQEVGVDS